MSTSIAYFVLLCRGAKKTWRSSLKAAICLHALSLSVMEVHMSHSCLEDFLKVQV